MQRVQRIAAHFPAHRTDRCDVAPSLVAASLATTSKQGRVAVVSLNRPDALNALSPDLMAALNVELRRVDQDPEVAAVVLTGAGKAFAAGADIKFMTSKSTFADVERDDFIAPWEEVLPKMGKPVVAAVNGVALGGGCEVAMMCDVIVASEKAKFGQPEVKLGTIPGAGGTQRLTRAIGKSNAMYLCLTGEMISAQEAQAMGLVTKVLPADKLLSEAVAIAGKMGAMSIPVLRSVKQAVNAAYETTLTQGVKTERRIFQSTFALKDRAEGMAAFVAKRPAKFQDE